jgi:hypothetical protein
VMTDESRFCLWQSNGRLCVRRPRGEERLNLQFALRRHSGLTPGVILWGVIQFGSWSPLVFIQGSLNAARYINEALGQFCCHIFKGIATVFFSKTTHKAKHCKSNSKSF